MTYDQWFRSQQGIPYECAYLFAEAAWDHQQKQIAELTRQRDLAVEALRASLDALRLPCDRWNKNQSMIISNALKIGEDALSTIKSEVKE